MRTVSRPTLPRCRVSPTDRGSWISGTAPAIGRKPAKACLASSSAAAASISPTSTTTASIDLAIADHCKGVFVFRRRRYRKMARCASSGLADDRQRGRSGWRFYQRRMRRPGVGRGAGGRRPRVHAATATECGRRPRKACRSTSGATGSISSTSTVTATSTSPRRTRPDRASWLGDGNGNWSESVFGRPPGTRHPRPLLGNRNRRPQRRRKAGPGVGFADAAPARRMRTRPERPRLRRRRRRGLSCRKPMEPGSSPTIRLAAR